MIGSTYVNWLVMKFIEVREFALSSWQEQTGRVCGDYEDDINGAYECRWQTEPHVSIFCSLGVWASCLSQELQDQRYDDLGLGESELDRDVLYLYYVRILLVVSEILNDLVKMYKEANGGNDKKARSALSGCDGYEIDELLCFVNTVIKHKDKHFHACNNHLPILFEGFPNTIQQTKKTVSVTKPISNLTDSLTMPSMIKIINTVAGAYRNLDDEFNRNEEAYEKIITKYGENLELIVADG